MAAKKEFSDQVKSKLNDLYSSIDDVYHKKACLKLYDVPITFEQILDRFKHQPFLATVPKSIQLDLSDLDFAQIEACKKSIFNMPKSKETAVLDMIKIDDFPEVKFMPSEMITVGNQKKFAAPRFSIDLSSHKIDAHCGVRINTGYIVYIKPNTIGRMISNGKIVPTTATAQPNIVIIPQIVSKHDGLVQAIYGRDPEDTGILTINFTTTKPLDTSVKMQVVLQAFVVDAPLGTALLYNTESSVELFKPKDNRTGRFIKNPRTKYSVTPFDTTTIPGSLLLPTFDVSKTPRVQYEKQKLKLDNIITIFTSRKREWCDSNLLTSVGFYNPVAKKYFEGVVRTSPDLNLKHNTHGMLFVQHRLTVFSVDGVLDNDCRILNGAFYNLPNYQDINMYIRKARSSLMSLQLGVTICREILEQSPQYKIEDLLRIYDYHRSLLGKDPRLPQQVTYSDEKLYAERPAALNCYSVVLYKSLCVLAYICCKDLFTPEQLEVLSLICTAKDKQQQQQQQQQSKTEQEENDKKQNKINKRFADDSDGPDDDDEVDVDINLNAPTIPKRLKADEEKN